MDTLEITRQFLSEQYGIPLETINSDMKLDDIGVDSLAFIDLVFEIEDKFGVNTSDEEIANIETVGEFISLIEEKRQQLKD